MLLEQCDEGDVEAVTNAYGVRWRQLGVGYSQPASVTGTPTCLTVRQERVQEITTTMMVLV